VAHQADERGGGPLEYLLPARYPSYGHNFLSWISWRDR
jgi:hypothetical protein